MSAALKTPGGRRYYDDLHDSGDHHLLRHGLGLTLDLLAVLAPLVLWNLGLQLGPACGLGVVLLALGIWSHEAARRASR